MTALNENSPISQEAVLNQFLDPGFNYDFCCGPRIVRSIEEALKVGINCISLSHLTNEVLFGFKLPEELDCLELFGDALHFEDVDSPDAMETGDLIWFGIDKPAVELEDFVPVYSDNGRDLINYRQYPVKHVGIFKGRNDDGEPQILHSTQVVGTNVVWPLSKFGEVRRYRRIYGIKRLRDEFKTTRIQPGVSEPIT